ncbi:unnamed protein product [Heligmosomoides polygyrus]|uniref:SRR1 domain-containing protein n=1 Tax=Heligmosomoides polygyrus TaxID=6339 RepID=A0A183F2A7_HELPZ|nr:unnamed protein product [Heligmosomoides polygyrus]
MVDVDSYINEMMEGMKLDHQHAQEQNDKARQRMKTAYDREKNVIERPLTLGERVYMRVPSEKGSSTHPKLEQDKKGRPKKNKSSKVSCFGVEIGLPQDDPLHLYYPCTCGIFNERAHVGLPWLRCNLTRSKKVKNLFELANVASIALGPAWGEHRKEAELMTKNSTQLMVVGMSCAISAHRHFCHDFATAIAEKEGVRLSHPPIFSHYLGYDISAYYAQAMARKDQINEFYRSDDMPLNSIIVALPKSFARATTDLEPEPTVKFVVYNHMADIADQLNKIPISSAIVWVWPEWMPKQEHMGVCLQAMERHLQCEGTLDCFPAPRRRPVRNTGIRCASSAWK